MGKRRARRTRAGVRLLMGAVLAASSTVGITRVVGAQTEAAVPDSFEATASAAGISVISYKDPNPLPVGPGAFMTFEMPEADGKVTATAANGRASVVYPGPLVVGLPSLLCLAGAQPFCGQPPPPVVAEAEHPQRPEAKVATEQMSLSDPAAPMQVGTGTGTATAEQYRSSARAAISGYRIAAPDPARQAILDALRSTLEAIPGAKLAEDDSLMSVGGGEVHQKIEPLDGGRIRTEATATINDIRMLAGAVMIDSVHVTSFAVTDGDQVRESGSSTKTSGVTVAGFDGVIGPEGIGIAGRGDGGAARDQLNGVAGAVADAVAVATGKLRMEVRDGGATRAEDGSSAAADGLRVSLFSEPLTEASPPQVPGLCGATAPITDPLREGGAPLPPICAVPDLTGTSDSYTFHLGRSSVAVSAQLFDVFDTLGGLGTESFGESDQAGTGGLALTGSPGGGTLNDAGTPSLGRSGRRIAGLDTSAPGFLALEARWLGSGAPDEFYHLYLALVATGMVLLAAARAVVVAAGGKPRHIRST